jgi:O-antigen/teichoic acid export membrane protein
MKLSRQIIHGVILTNFVTVAEMGVGFIQQVVIVRYLLGIQQYGALAFFQAGFGMLAVFFNLNLNYSAIRFGGAARGKEDEQEFYHIQGTTLFLTFVLNALLLLISIGLSYFRFEYEGKVVGEYFLLLAINNIASILGGFASTIYTSKKNFKLLSIQQILSTVLSAICILSFAYFNRTVKGAIYGMIAGSVAVSIASWVMVWTDFWKCKVDLSLTKSFGLYGGQFALSSIVKQFFWKADVILLGLFATEKAVGIYRIAQTVASPLMRVFSPLWTVLFPTVSVESGKGNYDNVKKLLFRGTQWLVLGNLPFVIAGAFLLDYFIPLIYGGAEAAILPIRLLLWGYALGTMTSVSPPILRVFRNDLALYTTIVAAILNILLNLILIPTYRANGAALANFISFGLLAIVVYLYAFRAIEIKVLPLIDAKIVIQVILIGGMMAASILNHVIIAAALLAVLFTYVFYSRIVTVAELKAYLSHG